MKVVALQAAKQQLGGLAKTAQGATVLITRDGEPFALLTGAAKYDWEDVEYMKDPEFWRMIEKARAEPTIPIAEVRRQSRVPARKRASKTRRTRTG